MRNNNIIISSNNNIELSETKSYLELTNLLCYYDEPNLNGVILPSENALEKAQTLVNMPVVAKYKPINGNPNLGGHEAYINPVTKNLEFDTDEIGTHTSVKVENCEIEINGKKKTLPCLYATMRIWTARHKNTVQAIKSLYESGKLTSSWEVSVNAYEYKDGVKVLNDYSFDANCLLGSESLPAYPCATVIDMSSLAESNLMIAEAIKQDKEEIEMTKKDKVETQTEPTHVEPVVETSAMTIRDLRTKLNKVCSEKLNNNYCYIEFVMVDENYCLCDCDGLDELEYYKFDYTISGQDITVSEPVKIKLVVSVGNINQAISERDNQILENQNTIAELQGQITELKKYKEIVDKEKAEKEKAEHEQKVESLKALAQTGGYISEKEISEDENIKKMISSLDEVGIKSLIVDRMLAKNKEDKTNTNVETSEFHADLSGQEDSNEKYSAFDVYVNLK